MILRKFGAQSFYCFGNTPKRIVGRYRVEQLADHVVGEMTRI